MDIEYISFDSGSELKEYLRRQTTDHVLLLGEDGIVINSAAAIIVEKMHLIIGLLSDGVGFQECQLVEDTLFVGYNNKVVCIRNGQIISKVTSDSPFDEFVRIPNHDDLIVAMFQLQVTCFTVRGVLRWQYYINDIISDYEIQYDKLILHLFEGGEMAIGII